MAAISASTIDSPIITINAATTINEKLTPSTFTQWRHQLEALLIGYDLIDFVTGVKKCLAIDATNSATSKARTPTGFAKINLSSTPSLLPPPPLLPLFLLPIKHPMRLGQYLTVYMWENHRRVRCSSRKI